MGSLNIIEVLNVIYRMSEGGFLRTNMLRFPRQIDIVDRLRVEKPRGVAEQGFLEGDRT